MAIKRSEGSNPSQDTRTLAREVAARSVAQLEGGLARILGETGANNRWLLGALVLLNGGGIALVAARGHMLGSEAIGQSMSFFVVGAALALLAALVGAGAALLLARQIGEASALWTQVASSGDLGEPALKAAARVRQIGLAAAFANLGLGLVSLILFVAGAMTLAGGLAPVSAGKAPGNPAEPLLNAAMPIAPPAPTVAPQPSPTIAPSPTPTQTPQARTPSRPVRTTPPRPTATPASTPAETAPVALPPVN